MTSPMKMTSGSRNREHGIALLFSLIALLLLTAITTSLIMLSDTDSTVNANYRSEEVAFFAAKAGIYEALDRMQQSNTNSNIACNLPITTPGTTATTVPTGCLTAPNSVVYLINDAGGTLTVQPWSSTNKYADTDLCHGGFTITGMSTSAPADVPCTSSTSFPSGTAWYKSIVSNYPWSGTTAALPYEWVRINWKQDSSVSYISGTGTSAANATYSVNPTPAPLTLSTAVCWNGGSEVLLDTSTFARCEQYESCNAVNPGIKTPVYTITALAVTSNGSRQMVQAEAALTPPAVTVKPCGIPDPYGFFAYGNACAAGKGSPMQMGGGGSQALNTDGFNSANGTYLATENPTGGAVGSNGSVWLNGKTTIGGQVYVQNPSSGAKPACPMDYYTNGSASATGVSTSLPLTPPTITIPPNTSSSDWPPKSGSSTAPLPNTYYNNVSISSGTVTLTAPGTYNFNCLSVGSSGVLVINPPSKAVTINITGNGCKSNNVIDFNAQAGINNSGGIAANLQFVYPGTGNINLVGAPSAYAVVIAPNASVGLHGGTDFFGAILANTFQDDGNVSLHYDRALSTIDGNPASIATATLTGSYNTLSFRSLPY